jgi:organic radical activating enzyme
MGLAGALPCGCKVARSLAKAVGINKCGHLRPTNYWSAKLYWLRFWLNKILRGVTLLGGEPLEQAENTVWLIQEIKRLSSLTVMLYTGYTKPEIEQKQLWSKVEANVDLLVSGRYQEQHRNTNNQWYGSENQELIYPKK